MGVKEEYRDKGVHAALLNACVENIPQQYDHIDCGWVLETNTLYDMSLKLGAKAYKTHRIYEKNLY